MISAAVLNTNTMISIRPISGSSAMMPLVTKPTPSQFVRTIQSRSLSLHSRWLPPQALIHSAPNGTACADDAANKEIASISSDLAKVDGLEPLLASGLCLERMPKHLAVIIDGHGRWARKRGLPPSAGHAAGLAPLMEMIDLCSKWGIKVLTVYLFSIENWLRPNAETDFFMGLYENFVRHQLHTREGVRISMIGDASMVPESLKEVWTKAEQTTKDNSGLHLILGMSYGGKHDITQACRRVARKVKDGELGWKEIDEEVIEGELSTSCAEIQCPDLFIRTSGEQRLSNFMLWQMSYTELYFCPLLWPDFSKDDFAEAVRWFQKRERRFGARNN